MQFCILNTVCDLLIFRCRIKNSIKILKTQSRVSSTGIGTGNPGSKLSTRNENGKFGTQKCTKSQGFLPNLGHFRFSISFENWIFITYWKFVTDLPLCSNFKRSQPNVQLKLFIKQSFLEVDLCLHTGSIKKCLKKPLLREFSCLGTLFHSYHF